MRWIVFILLAGCVAFGAAVYFEWVGFSVAKAPDGAHTDVTMKINHDEIKGDLDRARSAVSRKTSDAADVLKKETTEDKPKAETVRGVIRKAASNAVTLDVAGKTMDVKLLADTRITINGREGKVGELKVGQEVRCTHVRREGEQICRELVVLEETK